MKTPYEIVYSHKPTIAHFRAFICPCTLLDLESNPKFGAKTDDCYFEGYAGHTTYRVYNKSNKKIVELSDVRRLKENETDALVGPYCCRDRNFGCRGLKFCDEEEGLPVDSHMSPVLGIDPSESLDTIQPLSDNQQVDITETVSSPAPVVDVSSVKRESPIRQIFGSTLFPDIEPKSMEIALQEPSWLDAMHEELNQFNKLKVWRLVKLPVGKKALDTKWVFHNKQDDTGVIVRNKARLIVRDFRQVEGLDDTEVYAPVARIEAIRILWHILPIWDSRFIRWMSR
ncbi:uncharacterized protein LOC143624546 [Bidens hawaiensis]|uniref:uncharacterized protein LOC143624546 n=1 Tax=Bidens hawaiensis TaxID=980011 RepID=UPI00404A69C2